jgi:hypothetical protein
MGLGKVAMESFARSIEGVGAAPTYSLQASAQKSQIYAPVGAEIKKLT